MNQMVSLQALYDRLVQLELTVSANAHQFEDLLDKLDMPHRDMIALKFMTAILTNGVTSDASGAAELAYAWADAFMEKCDLERGRRGRRSF